MIFKPPKLNDFLQLDSVNGTHFRFQEPDLDDLDNSRSNFHPQAVESEAAHPINTSGLPEASLLTGRLCVSMDKTHFRANTPLNQTFSGSKFSAFDCLVFYVSDCILDPSVQAGDDEGLAVPSTPAQDPIVVTQPRPTSALHLINSRYKIPLPYPGQTN